MKTAPKTGPIVRAVTRAVAVDCGNHWLTWLYSQDSALARSLLLDPVRFNGDNIDGVIMRACFERGRFWQVQECTY